MEEKVLRGIALISLVMSVVICGTLYFLPGVHEKAVLAAETKKRLEKESNITEVSHKEKPEDIVTETEVQNAQLKIELPEGIDISQVKITNDYIARNIYIYVDTEVDDYFSSYKISGKCNHISSLSYFKNRENGIIALEMDSVYELEKKFEDGNLFLDFVDPHEIYDKIVVVDAGHGSRASGTIKCNVEEKTIDLQIVLKLKKLFDKSKENIGVYYTRLDDSNPTLDQRVSLANNVKADLFISVHNNALDNGHFSSLKGTQVLYSQSDDSKHNSKKFAKMLLDNVCKSLESNKIGLLKGDHIYIIRNSQVPVGLVEVGFFTNREELDKLQDEEYQKKAAKGIYNAVMQAFKEGY